MIRSNGPQPPSTAKAIEGAALPLQSINHIHSRNSLPPRVLSVSHRVANDILQEYLEHSPGLFVDQSADPLHASSPSEPSDRRLGDALDVVAQHLSVPLRASLAQALAALASSRHCACGSLGFELEYENL
ncbi:hypothetical protein Sjap_005741 [Stephania japonica]|uniref:Uncharacterized protein n=1 Tax=Stephania japonica TaxID=461633 RepID=A0AAP0PI99_9MAGN